jgi:two-component system, cell cycle response regulator
MPSESRSRILVASQDAEMLVDPLTQVYNRSALLSMLFRETDRVQRMKTPLCLLLMDIDGFGRWNSRLGPAACDELLRQVVERLQRLLRSYDLLGRVDGDEFLIVLPGCRATDAALLVDRARTEVFREPFHVGGEALHLSACFGLAASDGRSPVVVVREAETALEQAKQKGPDSIRFFDNSTRAGEPEALLSSTSGDGSLAW